MESVDLQTHETTPLDDLLSILNSRIQDPRCTLQCNPEELAYIQKLIQDHPALFHTVEKEMNHVLEDGILNIHNIPEIVLLLSQLFEIHFIQHSIQEIGIGNLVRFTVDAVLDSNLFHLPKIETEIIKRVVDVSLQLLSADVKSSPTSVCCGGLFGSMSKPTSKSK